MNPLPASAIRADTAWLNLTHSNVMSADAGEQLILRIIRIAFEWSDGAFPAKGGSAVAVLHVFSAQ